LYEFQQEDIDKLFSSASVLITNEMGTGKTYEAVALDYFRRQGNITVKTLVVCNKAGVEATWYKHFSELCPEVPIVIMDAKARGAFVKAAQSKQGGIFIAHWEGIRLEHQSLRDVPWYHIIADECQKMQNRKAQVTQAIKKFKPTFRTAMSGTPITTNVEQYWSVLNWLWPSVFRSYWSYYKRYITYDIKYPEGYHINKRPQNIEELLAILEPFTVRHLKKEPCCEHHPNGVMPWLPDKMYEQYWVDLTPVQRKAYNDMKRDFVSWVGAQGDKPLVAPVVIARLVRLQQFALAYAEVVYDNDEEEEHGLGRVILSEPSSKFEAAEEIILEHVEAGEQVVVYSQFSQAIKLLGKRLEKAGINHALYTGATSDSERTRIVRGFLAGEIGVFAGTIKAGGIGLDLFTASTVIFLDRSWSPSENVQAEDRLHRHGQKNSVRIIDIMARNTIDLGRKQQIDLKWSFIKQLLGDK